jgi:hypothetical protein
MSSTQAPISDENARRPRISECGQVQAQQYRCDGNEPTGKIEYRIAANPVRCIHIIASYQYRFEINRTCNIALCKRLRHPF